MPLPDFFADFGKRPPVYGAGTTPVYSNIGYSLLGRVLESVTGKTYAAYLQENVLKPMNMTRTSAGPPNGGANAFIPIGDSEWGEPLGYEVG
jgi:CubicO group peptidase (beta-lactamase class C family)